MAPSASQKRLALAIIDFLSGATKDGTLTSEDAESIEIATNCIAETFGVDASDSAAVSDALGGQNLLSIYSVYEKLKGRTTPSTEGGSSAKEGRPSTPTAVPTGAAAAAGAAGSSVGADGDNKAEAEKLKGQGNAAMQRKDYAAAIQLYTQALDLVPLQPIYLSNRAAAYSGAGRHQEAANDAEMAVAADPKFAKAWSRLGLARFALGDAKGSMEAYQKGIEAEGNGGSEAMKRGFETAKRRVEELGGDVAATGARDAGAGAGAGGPGGFPDLAGLSSMLGGGAGGQGGGMPNLSELMQNPMMRQMAQNLMSNPEAMQGLLNNPRLREMAGQFGAGGGQGGGQGGGMPDFSSMMQDPSIMEMARNLMGGGGAGGPGAPGAGRGQGQ
ncbi:glutamine-rich cytoplasmic protein [Phyllosticta capitalensis]